MTGWYRPDLQWVAWTYNSAVSHLRVSTFYLFCALPDFAALREPLLACAQQAGVRGTILLAREGVNGTIAGPAAAVDEVLAVLRACPELTALTCKNSSAEQWPFQRMKVKLKQELVPLGVTQVDPAQGTGQHVAPEDWNELVSNPNVMLIDARNDFETEIGQFDGAVDPRTTDFREFADWLDQNVVDKPDAKRVAMYCTGGIRCEKASAYLMSRGVAEVYQLEGGILRYLERIPSDQSLWRGECFVFDERVALAHGLRPGSYRGCPDCGRAVTRNAELGDHDCAKSDANKSAGSGNSSSI